MQGEDVRKDKSVPKLEMRLDKQAGTRLPGSLCREAHDVQKESIPEEASGCQAGITRASYKLLKNKDQNLWVGGTSENTIYGENGQA